MAILRLLHFNDVYALQQPGVDVSNFAGTVDSIRSSWDASSDLLLFSGDVFSPSLESTFTKGEHMPPVLNLLGISAACIGNHDFDFGVVQLEKLVQECTFPWLLSNIFDKRTGKTWAKPYTITTQGGVRIGIIALAEEDWIKTIQYWPDFLEHRGMAETGMILSQHLREVEGVELVIALTHSRLTNDLDLARKLNAKSAASDASILQSHGVDIILGGHDHMFYVPSGAGIHPFSGHDRAENNIDHVDDGLFVFKSGTDFRDLAEIHLELVGSDDPTAIRRKTIHSISGIRHRVTKSSPSSPAVSKVMHAVLERVSATLAHEVARITEPMDLTSGFVRTQETPSGNWVADALVTVHNDLIEQLQLAPGSGRESSLVDGCLVCAGSLRTDHIYAPGTLTGNDITRILPFPDPIVVIDILGVDLLEGLECGLSLYPALEGRFPVIAGMRVRWDSSRPPMQRVLDVCFVTKNGEEPLDNNKMYRIVTAEYMAEGCDGYHSFVRSTNVVDHEYGVMMCEAVHRHLDNIGGGKVLPLIDLGIAVDGRLVDTRTV